MENSMLEEGSKDAVDVSFTVNGMPLQVFKRFKSYARDWRDNYSVTIQVLMDKVDTLEYLMAGQEPEIEEVEYEDEKEPEEVQTMGN